MIRKLLTALSLLGMVLGGMLVTTGGTAHAGDGGRVRDYTVGQDEVVVKWGHLPGTYRQPLGEAVALINRYTTSKIVYKKWCGSANFCVKVDDTSDWGLTVGGALATHFKYTRAHQPNGNTWTGYTGHRVYIHKNYRYVGRWRLRAAFAHELGHVFTLNHDYQHSSGVWNKAPSIMGNNGQGSKRYFRVVHGTYLPDGTWTFRDSDRTILGRF